jgi:predicted ferric reductase
MVKLQVFVPSTYMWRPSQHCFLRIPTLSIFDSHPFTIASAPETNNSDNAGEKRIAVNS